MAYCSYLVAAKETKCTDGIQRYLLLTEFLSNAETERGCLV